MKRRGFSMMEMLCVLILLGAFGLVSSRLFVATMKLNRAAAQGQDATASFDAAMATLRADVWQARSIDVTDAATVKIDDEIVWTIAGNQIARSGERRWSVPTDSSFETTPSGIALNVRGDGSIMLINEPRILAKVMQ